MGAVAQRADLTHEQKLELLIRLLHQFEEEAVYVLEAEYVLRADRRDVVEAYEWAATDSLIAYPEPRDGQRPELTDKGRALLAASR